MAKFDLKFLDVYDNSHITAKILKGDELGDLIVIEGFSDGENSDFHVWLDKSTAIKFAKTLRTEINKIQD